MLHKELFDIIIFGSFVKGGHARDIDLALVVYEKIDVAPLKKKINDIFKKEIDIQMIMIDSLYSPLWLTLIKEGYSIKKNTFLSQLYNIQPCVLYKYSLKKLNNVQKVQFERGIKNVLGKKGNFLTRSVVLAPLSLKNEMMEFLKHWNVYYESQEYELLPLMRKEVFL